MKKTTILASSKPQAQIFCSKNISNQFNLRLAWNTPVNNC